MTTLTGTVTNGVVVLDGGPVLPEGTKVDVAVQTASSADAGEITPPKEEPKGTFAWMLEFAGKVPDLPSDLAAQHDHYLYGTPKR